jgi:hypothetical protein
MSEWKGSDTRWNVIIPSKENEEEVGEQYEAEYEAIGMQMAEPE